MVLRWLLINETVHGYSTQSQRAQAKEGRPHFRTIFSSSTGWGLSEERERPPPRGVTVRELSRLVVLSVPRVLGRLPTAPKKCAGACPPSWPHHAAACVHQNLRTARPTHPRDLAYPQLSAPAPCPAPLRSHCPPPSGPALAPHLLRRWPLRAGLCRCKLWSISLRAKKKNQAGEEILRKGFCYD